jgi:PAS domain S-box-containing protein
MKPDGRRPELVGDSLYRALFEALPGVTWVASPAGDLTYINDRLLSARPDMVDSALGDGWLSSVHPDDLERVTRSWAYALETGEPYAIEFRVRVDDGTYRWYLVRAQPVFDERGAIGRWVGVNFDVQDRHAADTQREMYAALVENSSDFISIADCSGRVLYVNGAGRALLEIGSLEDAVQTELRDYVVPDDRAFFESVILPALARDGAWNGDFRLRRFRSGLPIPVGYSVFALASGNGTPLGVASVGRDLRERQRIEDGLRLLSRTGAAVVDSLDYGRTLQNIARAFVDGFAAYCLIDVMPSAGEWERTVEHRDPAFVPLFMRLSPPRGNHPIARAIEAGESSYARIDDSWAKNLDRSDDRLEAIRALRVRSIISVPIKTPAGAIVGAITCALDDVNVRDDYGPDDLGFVEEVARRAGAAIANVQLYQRERRIALELQAASLPTSLPQVDGVVLHAAYRPGSNEAKIGGDWYDAFVLADKRLVITVGDVLGHGLQAAVSMTKLRLAMQSAAIVNPEPNLMLRVADATLRLSDPDAYATAIAAIYDPASRSVTFASAGHPGPALRTPAGCISELSQSALMLGLRSGSEQETLSVETPPGTTLVFYTDGLVEVVHDIDEGFRRLCSALRSEDLLRAPQPAEALVKAVLGADEARDDIAVLVVTFG